MFLKLTCIDCSLYYVISTSITCFSFIHQDLWNMNKIIFLLILYKCFYACFFHVVSIISVYIVAPAAPPPEPVVTAAAEAPATPAPTLDAHDDSQGKHSDSNTQVSRFLYLISYTLSKSLHSYKSYFKKLQLLRFCLLNCRS